MSVRAVNVREVLPQSVAALGVVGTCVLRNPDTNDHYGVPFDAGRLLCASPDGRALFLLRPQPAAELDEPRLSWQALAALDLHERFVHRRANRLYNCVVPALRKPVFAGELVILGYHVEKGDDDDGPDEADEDDDEDDELLADDDEQLTEHVHYFEKPNDRPAYPRMFKVGRGQFWVPPGEFRVADEGITYAPAPRI